MGDCPTAVRLRGDVLAVHRRGLPGRRQQQARARPGSRGCRLRRRGRAHVDPRGEQHELATGGYAFLPPGCSWTLHNTSEGTATFHWIRKAYRVVEGIDLPEAFVTNELDVPAGEMPETNGAWTTQRFADPSDIRHDMHVNIVNFEPGGVIPFPETHVMEHGLYVLEGKAMYLLNDDWVEVQEGDFMWLRAFCPRACYAGGPGRFRYLLYKDVNRHATLSRQFV
nr:(S)-ureidoglycine aminohydrolase [Nocardioides sp. B-3]